LNDAKIAILATLDTKGAEAMFVAELLSRKGHRPWVIDTGFRDPPAILPDVDRDEVAREAGLDPAALRASSREAAVRAMGEGAGRLLSRHAAEGTLAGVLALGGNQGTAIAGIALQRLPLGFPKVAVSTVASGNLRPYFRHKDVAVLFSVGDLLGGPNLVSRPILAAAAAAVAGMVEAAGTFEPSKSPAIAATAFGNTQAALSTMHALAQERGCELVAFHASGAGGSAMEELIEEGYFAGVADLTTHELLGEVFEDDIYAPTRPGRLTAAARRGLPQVVAPGGLDYFCFGGPDTIPARCQGRPIHLHNPFNANVRTTVAEMERMGRFVAARLNVAPPGTAAFLYPEQGWSEVGSPGGPLHDEDANAAFLDSLRRDLAPAVELHILDVTINDRRFAEHALEVLSRLRASMSESQRFAAAR
jgi:uncharacterized protein (UPF0261 family)